MERPRYNSKLFGKMIFIWVKENVFKITKLIALKPMENIIVVSQLNNQNNFYHSVNILTNVRVYLCCKSFIMKHDLLF